MAGIRPVGNIADPAVATAVTLKRMGQRHHYLSTEIDDCDAGLARIIAEHAPALLEITASARRWPPSCLSLATTPNA